MTAHAVPAPPGIEPTCSPCYAGCNCPIRRAHWTATRTNSPAASGSGLLIAAALACAPALVVADEPTTALGVTTQQQILDLLRQLVTERGVAMLFVTHDLGVVAQLCDEISVIYAGQTVETGPTATVQAAPLHPYTRALIACHPERSVGFAGIPGVVPAPTHAPPGCRFAPRCAQAQPACTLRPAHEITVAPGHNVDCILYETGP